MSSNRKPVSLGIAAAIIAIGAGVLAMPQRALAVADVPYFADANVEPNIFLAIDSSGSMDTADIPATPAPACGGSGQPVCRKRIDVAREVLSGFSSGSDTTDTGTGIVDEFGSQVRFVYGRFMAGDTILNGLNLALGTGQTVDSPYFRNDNLTALKSTIKNTPTDAWTPSSSQLLDVGCWILGEEGMNDGFHKVFTGTEIDPKMSFPVMSYPAAGTPTFSYQKINVSTFDWTRGTANTAFGVDWSTVETPLGAAAAQTICRSDMRQPHVREKALTIGTVTIPADPAFSCRQTFVIFVTDGEQSVGYGQGGRYDMTQIPSFDNDQQTALTYPCSASQTKDIDPVNLETSCTTAPFLNTTAVSNFTTPTTTSFSGPSTLSSTNNTYSATSSPYKYVVFTSTSAATAANLWEARRATAYDGTTGGKRFTTAAFPVAPAVGDQFVVVTDNSAAGQLILPCSNSTACSLANCPTNPYFNIPRQQKRRGWSANRVGTDRTVVYTDAGLTPASGRSGQSGNTGNVCGTAIGTWYENYGPGFRTVLSAMRQSTYLPAGAQRSVVNGVQLDPFPGPGVLTYTIGIINPVNTILKVSNDTAARFGGTDATPTNPERCLEINQDGNESFSAFSSLELTLALQRAIQCIIRGSYTRAAPAFIVSGAGYSSSQEIDAYFEVTQDNVWWYGHMVNFSFGEIAAASAQHRPPVPEFDAGNLLTARTTGNPRNIFLSTNKINIPSRKTSGTTPTTLADGAKLGEAIDPVAANEVIPFTTANTNAIQSLSAGVDTDAAMNNLISFIRDEDGAAGTTVKFSDGSVKKWALGPIVNSVPVIVEPPFFDPLLGGNSDTYIQFINRNELRPTMIYVGANDGLMHAFVLQDQLQGVASATNLLKNGSELFAFMPHEVPHRLEQMYTGVMFTVDGPISVATVEFLGTNITSGADDTFHTVLIGGMRSGGYSYYGLDVTDPRAPSVLWEISHPNAAKSFSKANINRFKVINNPTDPSSPAVSRWLFAVGAGFNETRTDDGDQYTINTAICQFYTTTDIPQDCYGDTGKTTIKRNAPNPVTDPTGFAAYCPGGAAPEGLCVDSSNKVVANTAPTTGSDFGKPEIGNWVTIWDIERGLLYQNLRVPDLDSVCVNTNYPSACPPASVKDPRNNSVPGDLLLLDRDQNGFIDNIMFGDVEGRLWKAIVKDVNPVNWWKVANAATPGMASTDSPCVMFDMVNSAYYSPTPSWLNSSTKRRPIFYAPSATIDCNGDVNLFFGTGDLTQTNDTTQYDYLFALKDTNPNGCTIGTGGTYDFACPVKGASDTVGLSQTQVDLIKSIYPVRLDGKSNVDSKGTSAPGEKILSSPVILNGEMYITTFIPSGGGCTAGKSGILAGPAICCNPKLLTAKTDKDVLAHSISDNLLPPPVRTPSGGVASQTSLSIFQGQQVTNVEESVRQNKVSRYFTVLGAPFIP